MALDISLQQYKVIIFDVDGTLYNQSKLRRLMAFALLQYYVGRPHKWNELRMVIAFRRQREGMVDTNEQGIEKREYELIAQKFHVSPEVAEEVITRWMQREPLSRLAACARPGAKECIAALRTAGHTIAIFSDYPAIDKLAVLGIEYDMVVCSSDEGIDRLKPDPAGLLHIMDTYQVSAEECVMIGDRKDRDGETAARAGMKSLIVSAGDHTFFKRLQATV